jgi:tetratricopeptide (TPR) repeat protein
VKKYVYLLLLGSLIILIIASPGERILRNRIALCGIQKAVNGDPCDSCLRPVLSAKSVDDLSLDERLFIGHLSACVDDPRLVVQVLSPIPITELDNLSSYSLAMSYVRLQQWSSIPQLIRSDVVPPSRIVDWALTAFNHGDLDAARMWLEVASSFPLGALDWSSQRWLGFLWMQLSHDKEQPIEYLDAAYRTVPEEVHVILLLAVAHRNSGDLERAVDLLLAALEISPGNLQLMKELALTYRASDSAEDRAKALQLRDQAELLLPNWQEAHPGDTTMPTWWSELDIRD